MRAATEGFLEILQNADITSFVFEAPFSAPENFDLGLRRLLLPEGDPYEPVLSRIRRLRDGVFYHLEDLFFTNYAIFRLPDEPTERWLSVGPVLISHPGSEQILALLQQLGLPASLYPEVSAYYDRLPNLKSQEVFDTLCFAVADTVFSGRDRYEVRVIHNSAEPDALQQMIASQDLRKEEMLEHKFERVRQRYELENAFLKAVMTGNTREALSAYYRFVRFMNELVRMPDRLRDSKDIGITLNSLLRKAAEQAGVHPYYIDAFSNANVARLEQCANPVQVSAFYRDLVTGYCELVQQYALSPYSLPVQNAIFLIQTELNGDLSLAALAERLNVSRNYLSTLFSREVGRTLGDYVLDRRIQRARHLLLTTPLPVQVIAWEVGIPDANYFARLFKRETGYTPRQMRNTRMDSDYGKKL